MESIESRESKKRSCVKIEREREREREGEREGGERGEREGE